MKSFRSREAARTFALRQQLFSPAAAGSLEDRHHLGLGYETENIFQGFRHEALEFFRTRRIKWHGNGSCDTSIVSSQVACVNCFFPFVTNPKALGCWLSRLYPDLDSVLPIDSPYEPLLPDGSSPFLTFEWIGERRYLKEQWGSRGQNCTSVDVLFRYRSTDGKVHLVLAEWKYCESYKRKGYIRTSDRGTDRVAIYRPELDLPGVQISLGAVQFEDLFFEPIDQIMRLQLLASAMERHREMSADVVSVLHISPRSNEGMLNTTLAGRIAPGSTVGEVWKAVAAEERFKAVSTEDLIPMLTESWVGDEWSGYTRIRYGDMEQ